MLLYSLLLWFIITYNNILVNFQPYVTHNENNQFFHLNNLNDDNLETLYSTGTILPNTTATITYNLDSIYCFDNFEIFWINIPPIFYITFYENNIYQQFDYITDSSLDLSEYYATYNQDSTTTLNLCTNNIYTNKIKVVLINNSTEFSHFMIRDIKAYGYDILNQLIDIQPRFIPINSIPEFHIDVKNNKEIRISNHNECINTYHLDNYKFTSSRDYILCHLKFPQPINITVLTLYNITPNILHISSYTKLSLFNEYKWSSQFGLSSQNCQTNTIDSISNIISNTIDFFEQSNIEGVFDVCYSFNNLWGNTYHKITLVRPIITSISGCEDVGDTTTNCPTNSNMTMTIKGNYFFNYYNNLIVRYGDYSSHDNILLNDTTILSILPEGTGKDIKVLVKFEIESESKELLSYKKPEINYITGCTQEYPKITNCPNNDKFIINIIGHNFGLELSKILIGSDMCHDVQHISHSNISCQLLGNRGQDNVIYVIQNKGDISDGQKLISYQECEQGFELIDDNCEMCHIGFYKDKISDSDCNLCPDGTYTNSTGNTGCEKCVDNALSNEERSKCFCKENYYMDNNVCNECDNLDFFGNDKYLCKESGLDISTLKNGYGYWRKHSDSVNFYKCKLEDNCPINMIINNTISCKEFHTGILCDFCISNYAKNNDGDCQLCEGNSDIVSGMLVLIIGIYITLIILTLIIGNKYFNKLSSGVIDIDLEDEGDQGDDEGDQGDDNNNSDSDDEDYGGINTYDNDIGSQLLQKLKIMITYIQINTILSINLNIKWPQFMRKVIDAFKKINLELFDFVGLSYRCSVDFNFYHIFIFQMFMIPIMFFLTSLSYHLVRLYGQYKQKPNKFFKLIENRYIYILVLLVFILYPNVCNTILQLYKCEEIEQIYYLSYDLSLQCYDDEWYNFSITGAFLIGTYILGIPYLFYRKLKYFSDNKLLDKKEIVYKYGFMFQGYEEDMWWFEILELMRKTILSASIIYLDESATRIIIAMFLCGIYLLYITKNQPRKDPDEVTLSILSASEIFLLLFCGLILEVKIDIQDAYNQFAFEMIMFIVFITILAIGNYQIIMSLRKNNIFTLIKKKVKKIVKKCKKIYNKCFGRFNQHTFEQNNQPIKTIRIIRESVL